MKIYLGSESLFQKLERDFMASVLKGALSLWIQSLKIISIQLKL